MSGHGGYKHRKLRLKQKRQRARRLGKENLARVRNQFEEKGQAWDPSKNASQAQALSHHGRRSAGVASARKGA